MTALLLFVYVVGLLGMTRVFIAGYRDEQEHDPARTIASVGLLLAWPLLLAAAYVRTTWIVFTKGTMPE